MAKRRAFVPENPVGLCLEGRIAPSISSWFSHTFSAHSFKELGDRLTPHHHSQNAAAGIQQLWKDSAKLSKPTPASSGAAHHVHTLK